jgi:hypothetical protein
MDVCPDSIRGGVENQARWSATHEVKNDCASHLASLNVCICAPSGASIMNTGCALPPEVAAVRQQEGTITHDIRLESAQIACD